MEISFCSHPSYRSAVMAWTKFCSFMIPYNGVTLIPIFNRTWITMEKPFVKWAPEPCLHTRIKVHIMNLLCNKSKGASLMLSIEWQQPSSSLCSGIHMPQGTHLNMSMICCMTNTRIISELWSVLPYNACYVRLLYSGWVRQEMWGIRQGDTT